jgi:hypothetical protein
VASGGGDGSGTTGGAPQAPQSTDGPAPVAPPDPSQSPPLGVFGPGSTAGDPPTITDPIVDPLPPIAFLPAGPIWTLPVSFVPEINPAPIVVSPHAPAVITSSSTATFTAGQAGAFIVTTSGTPIASLLASALPDGLTFTNNGDGMGILSGSVPTPGTYPIIFSVGDGTGSLSSQAFQLVVT